MRVLPVITCACPRRLPVGDRRPVLENYPSGDELQDARRCNQVIEAAAGQKP